MNQVAKTISIVLAAGFLFSGTVFAAPPNFVSQLSNNPNIPATASNAGQGRLRSCQARENAIKKRSSQLVRFVTNMEDKFDKIATRVENFYTNKVVPSGKTVSNYNSLVSGIQTKKAAVGVALAKAQTDQANFSCSGSDPKAQLQTFRVDMQNVKKALQDYRTSIKNLIVAVHSVVGETQRSSTPSAQPSK